MQVQVFQSNDNRRWKRFVWIGRVMIALSSFFLLVFSLTLLKDIKPELPLLPEQPGLYSKLVHPSRGLILSHNANRNYQGFRDILLNHKKENRKPKILQSSLVRAAFYTPWSPASFNSLKENAEALNMVLPEWYTLAGQAYPHIIDQTDDAGYTEMKKHGYRVLPMLINYNNEKGDFDGSIAHALLKDTAIQQKLITELIKKLTGKKLQGINIDLEEVFPADQYNLTRFVKNLSDRFHKEGLLVTMDMMVSNSVYEAEKIAPSVDYLILMAYDQHWSTSLPGPISHQKWIEASLDTFAQNIPSEKIILGIAGYGYDWPQGSRAESVTYPDILALAKEKNVNPVFDEDSYCLHFSYMDGSQTNHEVWFNDAATHYNTLRFADQFGTAGTALWRLGSEDPRLWTFYGKNLANDSIRKYPFETNNLSNLAGLKKIVSFSGEGEILDVVSDGSNGHTTLQTDPSEGIISDETYNTLPSGYIVRRTGEDTSENNRKIILTFDDGPSPEYTPRILDILEREHVPASFFIVGRNAEDNIPIVRRIWNDGFEIGNHTFTHNNIALMSEKRADVEMELTRMLIESLTGHSTILFRAPYNADSEPNSIEEILPIARSKKEHYYTVGESIDPMDWEPGISADSIYIRTLRIEHEKSGNIILLHDAGGKTREATIEALPRLIRYFKSKGYHFTTVADLMGKTKDDVMPVVANNNDKWLIRTNLFLAESFYWIGKLFFYLLLAGIILSVMRMVFIGILASLQKRKESRPFVLMPKDAVPPVSIIVPAYNEEKNAIQTIQSLLLQDYPDLEIIFVDDGSSDNTYDLVKNTFAGDTRVQVLTKKNGGKSSALNHGIEVSSHEIVVCIDADTRLKKDAVYHLVQAFRNPQVGAVAGNVKVGNERNMLTRWQSIEYITSQNFDRRAFDYLNCITVVPGALGAFQKSHPCSRNVYF
jgi:spore germination protein YaaH/peptidoglycan/xylan/chitin deacetylase (PgdA/CDA1 family)